MNLQIEDFKPDTSPLACSMNELNGWTTYSVVDVATFSLVSEDRTLFIENLFVTEDNRRSGIGTQVWKLIESAARKSGYLLICLSIKASIKDPTAAIAFGKSLGLRISQATPLHTGMSKALLAVVPQQEPSESFEVGA